MPGRPSGRSTRTSTTSTTRRSGTRGSASARTSAHAVEVPDEGPVTSLRTQICHVFGEAQKTTATQRKLVVHLRKIQEACCYEPPDTKKKGREEEDFDESEFNEEVTRCVLRVLGVKKSEPVGDRVIRFLGVFLKHATEKGVFVYTEDDEEAGIPETPSSRLASQILSTVLGFLSAKDKVVRFRAAQTVAHIANNLDTLDDDMFDLIKLGLLKRLRDKESSVRVQAVLGLGRLAGNDNEDEEENDESDDDVAGGILNKLLDIMINDPSAEVRRAILCNLPLWSSTLRFILERARDLDPSIRRIIYGMILPALGDFRHMSLIEREKLIRWGLRDRDDIVRKAAARLFRERWLEDCAVSHDTRPDEEKKPGEAAPPSFEALTELLERIDVTRSGEEGGMAHDAMHEFWDGRPDYREWITFDHEFWNDITAESAFVARSLNDYCQSVEDDRLQSMLEDKLPEVTMFAFVVQKHLNTLMELVAHAAQLEDDDPEAAEAQEEEEDQDFAVQQLLHIALTLDYSDEVGRRQMYNIMRGALSRAQLPEECTKLAVEVLRTVCGPSGDSDFCAVVWEAIAEVRDTLMDDDATEKGEDGEESFHSAQSDISDESAMASGSRAKKAKAPAVLDPEEEEEKRIRQVMVYSKCLHIAQCALQNVHCDLESDNSLTMILNTLIIPAVRGQEAMIRERGVVCLGLGALLSKDLALNNLDLFFHCFAKGHDALKEIVIQVLADIVITYPSLLAPNGFDLDASTEDAEPQQNPLIKPLTKMLLKAFASDNNSLSLMACTAASKLLLLGILPPGPTADILKAFTLTYFNPETAMNPALRQALSYFLPVFCHSKLKNAMLMSQVTVPVMSKLLLMREDLEEEADEMVGWAVITAHLAEWTDGRKVVGATELGLDGKTSANQDAEQPHIQLSIDILERALGHGCSKDERKPLLSLLSKLHISPTAPEIKTEPSDDEDADPLRTLHALVTEAVEGKLGMDVTQRNYLSKLEISLNKRLGEVEHVTQVQDEENTAMPDTTEATEVKAQGTEEEDEDTMLADMQGEGTRMPLEEEEEEEEDEEDESNVSGRKSRPAITEEDIIDSLLESEMSA
ncbi:ARM repeat-containing protein [Corynespora cassiicola Philippines]|uniref:ARM repeat-containing protein n=1 Tax=Corynespora cassiicola Philippines TaxID=1448308 RepID=A0A2T2PAV2_CORCC|nr:ARM repeat-containing protein [Corynespora cassiicola Philippines]